MDNDNLSNFNSIKVRLEQDPTDTYKLFSQFQFHKGAIRTFVLQHKNLAENAISIP